MGKKSKEPKTIPIVNKASDSDSAPHSTDVFKSLFGGFSQDNAAASLFSDNNPFRRKAIEPPPQLDSVSASKSEGNDVIEGTRKKRKDKRHDWDSDASDGEAWNSMLSGTKKSKKKLKAKEGNDGEGKGVGGGIVGDEENMNKKKRKRDEVENEYEAKRYGVAAELKGGDGGNGAVAAVLVGEKRKTLDNPAEMLVSKEGFDDESKLLRTVFVGNLPLKVKKKAVLKEFSQFGEIESVRIRSVPILDSKTPRKGAVIKKQINELVDNVHAYIVFKAEESATASLAHNMAVVEGNHLRVDRACPPRKKLKEADASVPLYDNKRTVFVGNLPFDVQDEELYQLFCGMKQLESSVEAVRVVRHSDTSLGKGIAYVLFKTKEAANFLVKSRNVKLRDRELRLSHAKADATPSKRKTPSGGRTDAIPTSNKAPWGSKPSPHSGSIVKLNPSSYQGLRANKSGAVKKFRARTSENAGFKSTPKKGEKKVRSSKRPAVAARKAGSKRKQETRTPESSRRNKKSKKS